MAGLEYRGSSFNVIVRFGGKRFVRSLKTSNETEAIGRKLRIEENIRLVESGRLSIPDDADVMTFLLSDGKLARKPRPQNNTVTTLENLFNEFFDALPTGNLEATTMTLLKIHRRHFERELGKRFPVRELSHTDLQKYVTKRAKQRTRKGTLSATTIRKEMATFRSIWHWAIDSGHLVGDFPNKGLRYPKTEEPPPFMTWTEIERQMAAGGAEDLWDCLYLSMEEVRELLKHVKTIDSLPVVYPMCAMAAYTGARRSELMRSQLSDIDLEGNIITLRERKRVKGKTSSRRVPIAAPLHAILADWLGQHPGGTFTFGHGEPIVRSTKPRAGVEPITPDQAAHYFQYVLKGSKWSVLKGWHCLRHSFISNCASKGIDQRMIDEWVGHTTESMRRRYRHLFPSSQHDAMQQLLS